MTNKPKLSFAELIAQSKAKQEQFETENKNIIKQAENDFLDPEKLDKTTPDLTQPTLKMLTLAELLAQSRQKQIEEQEKKNEEQIILPVKTLVPTITKEQKKNVFDQATAYASEQFPGIELDESQTNALNKLIRNKYGCLIGSAGCVDEKTEFLSPTGWKSIADWDGEQVAQWWPDKNIWEFVTPQEYVKLPNKIWYYFETASTSQMLSPEHRMPYISMKKKTLIVRHADDNFLFRTSMSLPVACPGKGGPGLVGCDNAIRLHVAICADGSIIKDRVKNVCVSLNKERKIERMKWLLNANNIVYDIYKVENGNGIAQRFHFQLSVPTKTFDKHWYAVTKEQAKIILDEMQHWDGTVNNRGNKQYFSTVKENVDFIQYCAFLCGYRTRLYEDKRNANVSYELTIDETRNYTVITKKSARAWDRIENPGYKYCFMVPSTFLVFRRHGQIFLSGNTGKTTVTKFLVEALRALPQYQSHPPTILAGSFTGRAAQVANRQLKLVDIQATTVHSMLGYFPDRYWCSVENREKMRFIPFYTETNKLNCDILLLDEVGMLPIDLWNNVVKALPEHCRVYLIGDIQQLPPVIGRSVLGYAMLQWPVGGLETIHRQAGDNPIIANAYNILKGQMPDAVNGVFNIVKIPDGSIRAKTKVIQAIKVLADNGQFIPETDVLITPQNKGALGQVELNLDLRSLFNPSKADGSNRLITIRSGHATTAFAVGDKVMQLQNDHQLGLTNGMIGFITEIFGNADYKPQTADRFLDGMRDVNLDDFDHEKLDFEKLDPSLTQAQTEEDIPYAQRQASHVVKVEFENGVTKFVNTVGGFNNLCWAYASTCHKCQGGEYRNVLIIVHASANVLLCREWLYTAVTRAQEKVILLANDLNMKGITKALTRQEITGSTLEEKANMFNKLQEKNKTTGKEDQIPVLNANQELGEDGWDKQYARHVDEKLNKDELRETEGE